jgi:hypothetical protein
MATVWTKAGDWFGSIRAGYETATKVAGQPDPAAGYLWRRRIFTIDRARSAQGLVSFDPQTGNTAAGNTLYVVNGSDKVFGRASDIYLLQKDDAIPTPQGSGLWQEKQIAVSYGEWEEWEIPV